MIIELGEPIWATPQEQAEAKLVDALEFYARCYNFRHGTVVDEGQRARAALAAHERRRR